MIFLAAQAPSPLEPMAQLFETPFRVKAGAAYIDVDSAHAAPLYEDIDGDGLNELVVGQFKEGRIRLYRNHGTNAAPIFKDFTWLKAGGFEIRVGGG